MKLRQIVQLKGLVCGIPHVSPHVCMCMPVHARAHTHTVLTPQMFQNSGLGTLQPYHNHRPRHPHHPAQWYVTHSCLVRKSLWTLGQRLCLESVETCTGRRSKGTCSGPWFRPCPVRFGPMGSWSSELCGRAYGVQHSEREEPT